MLKSYVTIALRHLVKNKVYGIINIAGLATGMAVALLIGIWIWDEVSFDHYHDNHARLGLIRTTRFGNGVPSTDLGSDIPLAEELRSRYGSHFKHLALSNGFGTQILAAGNKKVDLSGTWAQPELPEMLTLHMLAGSRDALKDPSSILLAASLAHTLFGNADAMNQRVRISDQWDVKVAGIYEDLPANTLFSRANFFLSWDKYADTHIWVKNSLTEWGNHFSILFVQLADHADFAGTEAAIRDIPAEHLKESKEQLLLHPMDKWHLYNEFKNGKIAGGRIQFVWLFGIIGGFVLLLACINFMNLSTARSEQRAKEVGVRKSLGSLRGQLIGQFLSESVIVSLLALVLALILAQALLPFFNQMAGKQLSILWSQPLFWVLLAGFTVFTGLIAGSYPAFYLSAFDPIQVLKGAFRTGRLSQNFVGAASPRSDLRRSFIPRFFSVVLFAALANVRNLRFPQLSRKVLVIVQFTVSIALAIGSIIVFHQIQFARNRPVGYSREGLVTILTLNSPGMKSIPYDALRHDLLQTGAVEEMTESSGPQTNVWSEANNLDWPGKDPNTHPYFGLVAVTHDYGNTIRWKITAGRDFSRSFATDSAGLILNEAAVRQTGLSHPIGQTITYNQGRYKVVGVVKDMVMESPYSPVEPTIFFLDYHWNNYITFRIRHNLPVQEALARVTPVFKKYDPASTFNFQLTDDDYATKFAAEERIGNLATFFTTLALFISCLGLFGLASFVAEQRTKEIGVRKVLGASLFNLWQLLSKDFVILVVISCLIAIPLSSYFLHQWLQKYEYHTTISGWIFFLAGIGALLITLSIVSYQTLRAANMNPVKSLRSE